MKYDDNSLMNAAMYYASQGLAVFPLKPRDKVPIYNKGFKIATTDLNKINMWWTSNPDANIGIACGEMSGGLVVIDCDKHEEEGEDGFSDLQQFAKTHNENLPDTLTVTTGSGGTHLLFKSKTKFRNRTRVYGSIDVRADGGYIVAPPSIHPNGNSYEFDGGDPNDTDIIEAPKIITDLINLKPQNLEINAGFTVPDVIGKHSRNDTLFKTACKLRSGGFDEEMILNDVLAINKKNCEEPLADDEVRKIVESACKYEKGSFIVPSGGGQLTAHTVIREPVLATNDKGFVIQSIQNCQEVIEYDKDLYERIKFNDLVGAVYVVDFLPWDNSSLQEREWTNNDDCNLLAYLERYGLKNQNQVMTALSNVAHKHHYHPVRDMLEGLEKKYPDAKGYIENLLPDYLGADKTTLNTTILRLWMLGAVSRVFSPGIKFDTALILVGGQGAGKSTLISRMALNHRFYNDNLNTIEGDKAFEKIRGIWIAEMAELLAQKGSRDVESIKAFITSQNDRYREPYSRRSESHPRQCVFAGTTNEDFFLVDTTGNRRFLPVRVDKHKAKKNVWEAPDDDFEMAWAEAMHIYRTGNFKLIIPPELEYQLEAQRSQFQEENVKKGIIEAWVKKDVKPNDLICIAMVWECALGESGSRIDMKTSKEIGALIDSIPSLCSVGKQRVGTYGSVRAWKKIDFSM